MEVVSRSHFPNVPGTAGYHGLTWPSALWPRAVASRELRYLAVAELIEAGRSMSAMELAEVIQSRGLVIRGDKPNKTVADALRWEVAKGRVLKPGRGRFQAGRMPRSTKSWIRGRARNHYRLAEEFWHREIRHR
ncbi:MAG: winged helix-turn-helix domain-containing protein [Acidimicrobiia bacterium]|nr:winged helix-turn-helix domain-containing protein [Acidimicrobiia bacterium]